MIKRCACIHPAQDSLHGFSMRVHNMTKAGGARCTVCGKINTVSAQVVKDLHMAEQTKTKTKHK